MIPTWVQRAARLADLKSIAPGVAAGGVGLIISVAGRGIIPGRMLGDPLPLALSVSRITTGFTYFNWRAPLFHALFAAFLGLLATVATWLIDRERFSEEGARRAGRIAAGVNIGLVALLQVDAPVVGLWYLMGGVVSLLVTTFIAGKAARFRHRGMSADPASSSAGEAGQKPATLR